MFASALQLYAALRLNAAPRLCAALRLYATLRLYAALHASPRVSTCCFYTWYFAALLLFLPNREWFVVCVGTQNIILSFLHSVLWAFF